MIDISWMSIQNMEYSQLGYFAKFTLPMSQVHFPKSQSPHLSNCEVYVAISTNLDDSF
jgi:hypothetical protein